MPLRRRRSKEAARGRERRGAGRRFTGWLAGLSLWRLVAVFILLGLLPLALLIYYSISVSSTTVRGEVKARIRAAATVSAELVQQEMSGVKTLVDSYASRPFLVEALSPPGGGPPDQKAIRTQIEELRVARPGISVTFLTTPSGRLIDIAPSTPSIVGSDFSFRDWYKGVTRTDRPYVSEVYRSAATGHPSVSGVAAPIFSPSGRALGILVAAYGADELQAFVDRFERSQGVSLTIGDQNGVPVVNPGSSEAATPAVEQRAVSAALRGSSGILEGADEESDELIAYSPVKGIGWTVTATTPNAKAFAPVDRLQSGVLLIGGLVALALSAQLVLLVLTLQEHRKVAKRLRDSEEASRMVVEAAGEAFISINDQGLITGWNRRSEETFGWSQGDALGRSLAESIVPERYREAHEKGIEHYLATGDGPVLNRRVELSAVHRDGREFPVELLIWPLTSSAGRSFNAFVQDITERKESQDQLAAARDAALDASRFKSEFLANMSHEIRTPMNAVIGMTGLLLDDPSLTDEQRDFAETVRTSAEALLVIINDILDFSKIEAGAMQLEMIDFELGTVVENVADLLASTAHKKGLELVTLVESNVPRAVRGDAGRLRQVLTNLAGNAIKFTGDGDISIAARAIDVTTEGSCVRFEVKDTGIGIAEDAKVGLFDAFSQADESTTRRYGGTGLGLAICKRLVDLMGGEIGLESEPGKGSTFWFTVPFEASSIPEPQTSGWDLSALRALIVDDSGINRRILTRQLASWGMSSDEADGARAALALLEGRKGRKPPYDLVILDKEMPEMDGLELAAALRGSLAPRHDGEGVAMLLLTSSGHRPSPEELQRVGIGAALTKPVGQSQLFDYIAEVVDAVKTDDGPAVRAAVHLEIGQAPSRTSGPVLVAEDNPANQKLVRAMLKKLGYRADIVANGLEAVEAAGRIRYDVIFMDCQMPDMDGFRATAEIRSRERQEDHVVIIALTAGAMKGDRERALEAGMDDYITKPVRLGHLAEVLTRWTSAPEQHVPAKPPGNGAIPTELEEKVSAPIIDHKRIAYLEAECGEELVVELMGIFLDQAPATLASLREAVETSDAGGIERTAHHLKGSSGNIGAAKMEDLCAELEALGRLGDVGDANAVLERLEEGFEEVGPALVAANASWKPSAP